MSAASYDVLIIGTGPGGYETAIRATQLGLKTAVVEKNKLGGVCLNIGCIPTKALLKSAEIMEYSKHLDAYGLTLDGTITPAFDKVVQRSRGVADKMNKGIQYLMSKNKIDVLMGKATLAGNGKVDIEPSTDMDGKKVGEKKTVSAKHIIVATGARPRELPSLPFDGKKIISSTEALTQTDRPARLLICGAGAIGVEFAYFYHNMGTEVTIIELQDRMVPVEDKDVSRELARAFKKQGIKVMTGSKVSSVDTKGKSLQVKIETKKGVETIETDQVLSAVGVVGNIESLGLEKVGVKTDRGAVVIDEFCRTNVPGIYAIGDVAGPPWLAHKASHEGVICVEKIAGENVHPMNKLNIPGCTYCQPQIASVGYNEEAAKEAGHEIKVGKFPFTASGKASAMGHNEGFVKVIYDAKYGEFLGCHIIGYDATEMIAEAVTARTLETTAHEIMESIHPHPTLSEAVLEATRAAYGKSINM
ncbi:MAG: dihydrolipoyl dehydrogenase [Bacteroidetes Order II. Incertae sedis bacterium]|jgi:dihydrolipoamide dehydrogenase|nr:dihydrolipoyl dehydrogenase [Bacteroidetes Order II. bacterium]MDG1754039.1 dihydrolipoyl dehydrogenase [Rhodothermales bacterium]HAY37038.1 dihydrolipoyl dehydrogenase [Bacteroidota bacterium]MBT4602906.1 dihydrolipoyl dehydrogenase [Bacteroidetes Order II. bacterium]MBT5250132.1 dihydrolipoyl dehydrogenase [Bacteroidetes Order II. bacterium]